MLSTHDTYARKTLNILHTGNCHDLSYKLSALLLYTKKRDAFPQETRIKRIPSIPQSIETLSEDRPDVIVLEFERGDQQELQALRQLRRSVGDLPIVVISAAAEHPKFGHQAIYNGANDYFPIQSLSWSIFSQALNASRQQIADDTEPTRTRIDDTRVNGSERKESSGSNSHAHSRAGNSMKGFRKMLNARIDSYAESGLGNAALIQCNLTNYSHNVSNFGSAAAQRAFELSFQRLLSSVNAKPKKTTSSGGTIYLLISLEGNAPHVEALLQAAAKELANPIFIGSKALVMDVCFGIAYLADDTFSSAEDWMIAAQVATQIAQSSGLPYYFSKAFPMEDLDALYDD